MDSILSTVLSVFRITLSCFRYHRLCCFSIIRGKNNEESDEYESYESSSSGMTWEDMEREYGISIERKVEEPSSQDSILTVDNTSFENRPKDDVSTPATATQQDLEVLPKKRTSSSSSYTKNTTRLDREAVPEAPLNERLAEFKRDKASKRESCPC